MPESSAGAPASPDRPPTVAERRFAERAAELAGLDVAERFARVYETNLWEDAESRSGVGSSLAATARLRAELPGLLRRLGVRRLLDVPCGDFHWMARVDLDGAGVAAYVGGDVVPAIVADNRARHGAALGSQHAPPARDFVVVDLAAGPLPAVDGAPADAVLCRDCLVHLSFANVARALRVVRASGARCLITTTFPARAANADVVDGDWRPLNLERPPFAFPPPVEVLVEGCDEAGGAYADKALAVWRVADLPDPDTPATDQSRASRPHGGRGLARGAATALAAALGTLLAARGLPAQAAPRPAPRPAAAATLAQRLGYPADAKLLILHADDLGVAHSVDSASLDALERGVISSASVMMPTPWVTEVAAWARAHPDHDLGLHLTLTSEWKTYRWGTVAPSGEVPTLLDSTGTLPSETRPVAERAAVREVERELRAQVARARALGIQPTHLDSHMGALFTTPALYGALMRVARDERLPFLAARGPDGRLPAGVDPARDVVLDTVIVAGPEVPRGRWTQFYVDAVRALRPGLSEILVHLGRDDAELRAVTVDHEPYGSAWRQRDDEAVRSPEFRRALRDNGVVLVRWRDVQRAAGGV